MKLVWVHTMSKTLGNFWKKSSKLVDGPTEVMSGGKVDKGTLGGYCPCSEMKVSL